MISAANGTRGTSGRTLRSFATNAVFALFAVAVCAIAPSGRAQSVPPTPPSLITPDKVESRVGPLEFADGVPSRATAERLFDNLDLT